MFEQTRQGAVSVISGDEPLNAETVDSVRELLNSCTAEGRPAVVIDMKKIPLIDSAGLELLVESRQKCISRGGIVQLAAPDQLCRDILRVTGVDNLFELHDDVVAAVGSFAR
jgi:anti-sigma B factor antagonist